MPLLIRPLPWIAVLVVFSLSACSGSDEPRSQPEPSAPGATPTASAPSTAPAATPSVSTTVEAPKPLSVPAYRALLGRVDAAIRPAARQVHVAGTMPALSAGQQALVRAMRKQADGLEAARPPAQVAAQHSALTRSLRSAADRIEGYRGISACGGAPALSDVIERDLLAKNSVAASAAALRSKGIQVGTFLPAAPTTGKRRGENGEVVERRGSRGYTRLEVDNTLNNQDVAVSVVTGAPTKPQAMMYVRAGSRATYQGTRGTYNVYFKSGHDWDDQRHQFTKDCTFEKFDDPFTAGYHWTISLVARVGGNASTTKVDPF
ncbi:hypothetical protein OG394_30025 [Kribbella sp. NBC_01245]|uniref:hypothetical protein n=1 Tax=Kribbella sp. NBC_01245 TaxID=2903578 RepID=UPI002E2A56A5|nr:hypothetical protein [Kribbella sp. NBC_01245]